MRKNISTLKNILAFSFSFSLSLIFLTSAHADSPVLTLKENMSKISEHYKVITSAVNDKSKNKVSAAAAKELSTLFTTVQGQMPDSLSELPPEQQEGALTMFKSMIQEEIDNMKSLEKAFLDDDNAGAAVILKRITDIKRLGHKKFDP